LPYLTNNADIKEGDLLVSSGLGGVFPSGYPVGRVLEVRLRPDQAFAEIMAEPASALDRDREVLLVWNAADEAPRASEAAAAASVADVQ
jgi:rod shape-determining protein MreC